MTKWIFVAAVFGLVFGSGSVARAESAADTCKRTQCAPPYNRCSASAMKIKNDKQRNDARTRCSDALVACRKKCDRDHK